MGRLQYSENTTETPKNIGCKNITRLNLPPSLIFHLQNLEQSILKSTAQLQKQSSKNSKN